jgi:hypothetical protein
MGLFGGTLGGVCLPISSDRQVKAAGLSLSTVMRYPSSFRSHLLLVSAMLCQVSPIALADSTGAHSKFAGVYRSQLTGPSLVLSLGADGSATVTEDPGTGAITLFGHWVDSGGQVAVHFDAVKGEPAEPPMVFQPAHDGLQAVTWNHASWGKVDPPPMRKGGYKVKETYWFTTVR